MCSNHSTHRLASLFLSSIKSHYYYYYRQVLWFRYMRQGSTSLHCYSIDDRQTHWASMILNNWVNNYPHFVFSLLTKTQNSIILTEWQVTYYAYIHTDHKAHLLMSSVLWFRSSVCQMLSVCADVWFVHCSFAAFAFAPQCVYSNSWWILSWFQDFAPGVQSIRFCSSIKIPEQQLRQLSLPQAHHIFQDTFRNSRELQCISSLDTLMHFHQWAILWQYGYPN